MLADNETGSLQFFFFSWLKFVRLIVPEVKGFLCVWGKGWVGANKLSGINVPCQKEEGVSQLDGFSW